MPAPDPVVVLVADLFFRARIEAVAEAVGRPLAPARSVDDANTALAGGTNLVLVDLGHTGLDAVQAIAALKSRDPAPRVIAFGSHVDAETLKAARAAGADRVMARSAFTERLVGILKG